MADLRGNPWTFTTADQATSTTITSITRNAQGSALVTSTAHGRAVDDYISIQGTTPYEWRKVYRVLAVPSANTFLVAITPDQTLLSNAGAAGNVVSCIYHELIEVTQMLWDAATTGSLLITDQAGRTVWAPASPAFSGTLAYMKAFPINGLCLNTIGTGTLQISI